MLVAQSCLTLFATSWTIARWSPLSMEFSRQKHWSGLSFPSPEDLANPGIKPRSPSFQADSFLSEPSGKPLKKQTNKQTKTYHVKHAIVFFIFPYKVITTRKIVNETCIITSTSGTTWNRIFFPLNSLSNYGGKQIAQLKSMQLLTLK